MSINLQKARNNHKYNLKYYETNMFKDRKIPVQWISKIYGNYRQSNCNTDTYVFVVGRSNNDFIVRGILETISKNFSYNIQIFDTELALFDYNHPKEKTLNNTNQQISLFN